MVNLGGGRLVPYPLPSSAAATKMGVSNLRTGTKPEVRIRSALHRAGFRFRKDFLVRCGAVKTKPDIVFTRARIAVFVDGCFWHGCPDHQVVPKRNRDYWVPKLAANVERDLKVNEALEDNGWTVVRIWEHEPVDAAVQRVRAAISGPEPA